MINVPKPEVLKAGIRNAEADLEHWNQSWWVHQEGVDPAVDPEGKPVCGATACLAGHILLAQGVPWRMVINYQRAYDLTDGEIPSIGEVALDSLGWTDSEEDLDPREEFMDAVFEYINDYQPDGGVLARTQERLDLLKARITEFTGITFDEEVPA